MAKILIVEDNQGTNKAICEYMKEAGHMVVFGQGKKMGAAFSILYLCGVRPEGSIAWVLPSGVSPRYAGGVSYF